MEINKNPWFKNTADEVLKLAKLNIPIELVHFPSCGLSAAINRLPNYTEDLNLHVIIIDLRTFNYTEDTKDNQEEFYRILDHYIEQSFTQKDLNQANSENIFLRIKELIKKDLSQDKQVLIIFKNLKSSNLYKLPQFSDLLILLNNLRDNSKDKLNFIITTNSPSFNNGTIAPIPLLTKYFNHYDKEILEVSIDKHILSNSEFINYSEKDIDKLFELSGGLMVIVKSIVRDLAIHGYNLSKIYDLIINEDFFEDFINVKFRLDRIQQILTTESQDLLLKILENNKLNPKEEKVKKNFQKMGIIDDNGKIRGIILPAYLSLYCSKSGGHKEQDHNYDSPSNTNQSKRKTISESVEIDPISGEIYIGNEPNEQYLSEKELDIVNLFLQNRGNPVSRDDIAEVLWGTSSIQNYSDWAIDKTVSRIRYKLEDKKPYRIIKTLRSKGFMLT